MLLLVTLFGYSRTNGTGIYIESSERMITFLMERISPWMSLGEVQFTPTAATLWQESATAAHSVMGSPLAA